MSSINESSICYIISSNTMITSSMTSSTIMTSSITHVAIITSSITIMTSHPEARGRPGAAGLRRLLEGPQGGPGAPEGGPYIHIYIYIYIYT